MAPIIIGLAGGTASGKTTTCHKIKDQLNQLGLETLIISMDRFYKSLPISSPVQTHNFDVPDAYDFELFKTILHQLRSGQSTHILL
jgi:uridine kinase